MVFKSCSIFCESRFPWATAPLTGKSKPRVVDINTLKACVDREKKVLRLSVVAQEDEEELAGCLSLRSECESYSQDDINQLLGEYPDVLKGEAGKIKQDITVADCTDNSRLTIWEDRMNTLDKDASYTLKNIVVRQFRDKKYLSFPRCGLSVMKIPDIGTVEEDGHNRDADESTTYQLIEARVIAVVLLDSYNSYISCRA